MKEKFQSVYGNLEKEIIIERSRFITSVINIKTEDEAKAFIEQQKKLYPCATHYCFAYIIGPNSDKQKFSDDGEPQGTAGFPILETIRRNDLTDTMVIVTRYFGGIKLGAGGLTRAYSSCSNEALKLIDKVSFVFCSEYQIDLNYEKYQKIFRFIENKKIKILDTVFDENVSVRIVFPKEKEKEYIDSINNYFSGAIKENKISEYFYREI